MCGGVAPPVTIRQAVPVYSSPNIPKTPITSMPEKGHATPIPEDSKPCMKPKPISTSAICVTQKEEEGKFEQVKVEEKLKELHV